MKTVTQIQDQFIAALGRPNAYKTLAFARVRAEKALRAWGYNDAQVRRILDDAREVYLLQKNTEANWEAGLK